MFVILKGLPSCKFAFCKKHYSQRQSNIWDGITSQQLMSPNYNQAKIFWKFFLPVHLQPTYIIGLSLNFWKTFFLILQFLIPMRVLSKHITQFFGKASFSKSIVNLDNSTNNLTKVISHSFYILSLQSIAFCSSSTISLISITGHIDSSVPNIFRFSVFLDSWDCFDGSLAGLPDGPSFPGFF